MSTRLSVRRVCEEALRKIGAFSINDTAADGNQLAIAINWLDLVMAELSGSTRLFWLISDTLELPLDEADRKDWPLPDSLSSAPDDGIQFPVGATLVDENDNRTPLTIVARDTYLALDDPNETGVPNKVFIDRLNNPTLYVHPVPDVDTFTIELVVQTFAKSVSSDRPVNQKAQSGNTDHGIRTTWQRWAIYQLAADLGDGTIRTVAADRIERFEKKADKAKNALLAFENREHETEPAQTAMTDF